MRFDLPPRNATSRLPFLAVSTPNHPFQLAVACSKALPGIYASHKPFRLPITHFKPAPPVSHAHPLFEAPTLF
jgi:hypothetical protein